MFSKKDLTRLMVPLIIEQILAVAVGMIDVIMVAKVGEAAVSGVSLVDSINILLIQLFSAMATGGAVVAAQYIGSKNIPRANLAAQQLLFFSVSISVAVTVFALSTNGPLLKLAFGRIEADVMDNARIYFYLTALSFPFLAIYNSCAALFRAMGNSRISMMTSLWMNAINVAGNFICIYLLGMGVEGVAIPTLISRGVAAVMIFMMLRRPQNVVHLERGTKLRFYPQMIKKILQIGIPNGLESSIFQFGKIILQSLVSTLGTVALTGFGVASNLVTLEYLPGNALGLGLITIVGQCAGAGEYEQARQYTKKVVKLNYIILAVICTVLAIFAAPVVGIYHLSEATSAVTVELLVLHSFCMIIWPLSFTLPNALRAAADVKFTMCVSVFSMWVFRIGCSYLLVKGFGMGVNGIWIAMFVDWVFRAILFVARFVSGRWKGRTLAES